MKTADKTNRPVKVFVFIESFKDPKKEKTLEIHTTYDGLQEQKNFNGPDGKPVLSRFKVNKGLEEKGKFTYSDFERHIEISKVEVQKRAVKPAKKPKK